MAATLVTVTWSSGSADPVVADPAPATSTAPANGRVLPQGRTGGSEQNSRSNERPSLNASQAAERDRVLKTRQRTIAEHSAALEKARKAEAARKKRAAEKARQARITAQTEKLGYTPGTTDPRSMAKQIMANQYGWGAEQFRCYDNIIMRESMWDPNAENVSSGAYGIPQALPGSKMASAGSDWRTNPATQIRWGLGYVKDRYGTPCGAWGFKSAHGWY